MTGPIRISILADGSRARRELGSTSNAAEKMGKAFRSAGRIAGVGLAAAAAGVTAYAAVSLKSLARIERIGAQTDAAIKSTGGIANVTRDQIDALAGSLENYTATEAESITEGANFLLTFTNIRNEAGKNNDIFNQSVVALTDMTRALDNTGSATIDTRKQALQLGKSLNDPIKGVTALKKVGVSFTEEQQEQIKTLVDSGKVMKAQKIILHELNKEFGGSAEAFGKTTTGRIELAKHAFGTLGETIFAGLLPPLGKLATAGVKGLEWANDFASSKVAPKVGELADYIAENKDEAIDFAREVAGRVMPVVEELGEFFVDTGERVYDFTRPIVEDALPALGALVDVVGDAVGWINDLPGPVKDVGIQVGIAALVLPRLSAGVTTVTGAMATGRGVAVSYYQALRYGAASSQQAAAGAARLASAARTAAGIGGILALTKGMQESDKTAGTLMTTLGGAAVGFSVGGPWGALIGGGAGLAMGLFADRTDDAGEAMRKAAPKAADYAASLDEVTGAATRSTRELIINEAQTSGILATTRLLGISTRDLTAATLGKQGALERVNASLARAKTFTLDFIDADGQRLSYDALSRSEMRAKIRSFEELGYTLENVTKKDSEYAQGVRDFIGLQREGIRLDSAAAREKARGLQNYNKLAGKVPRRIISELRPQGIYPTITALAKVANRYKSLDNKQLRAIIGVTGVPTTVKEVRKVAAELEKTEKVKPKLKGYTSDLDRILAGAGRLADVGVRTIGRKLEDGTKTSKADMKAFKASVQEGVDRGEITARQGALAIGSALKNGLPPGFSGAGALWSAQVAAAVHQAIQAGRNAAGVRSPSKQTEYIGKMMGDGLVIGMRKSKGKAGGAGRDLIASALAGIGNGSDAVDTALDRLTDLIRNRIKRKKDKDERAAEKRVLAGLKDEYEALRKIGKAHDEIARKLEKARDVLKQRQQQFKDYVSTVRASFQAYGNLVGLGANEDGSVNIANLLDQLRDRVANAQRFAQLIRGLRDDQGVKLTDAALQQLIDAGPEAALATAEALAAGGDAAVRDINKMTDALAAAGEGLGTTVATQLYQAGINAAEAMVKGLEKRQRRLDQMADRFGNQIAHALQAALQGEGGRESGGKGDKGGKGNGSRPRLAVADTTGRSASGRPVPMGTLRIVFTAEQQSQMARGKAIVADLDYALDNGVRSLKVVTKS